MTFASQAITEDWKDALGLSARSKPEVYSDASAVGDVPHARPIRTTLRDLGADSVFCIEDVPTAVFFAAEEANPADIAPLHSDLWNQGLASVLAIVYDDTIRIYSLAAVPEGRVGDRLDDDCLIEVLHKVADAAKVRSLTHGMESGRYWQEHSDRFKPEQRVDGTLLGNLKESDKRLRELLGLPSAASQALLMQTMFIAYLEDRGIIGEDYIKRATHGEFSKFGDILDATKVTAFHALFRNLNRDFNGDLFVKPCSFDKSGPRLQRAHLPVLARFRSGMVEMGEDADQGLLFWAYNFELIPVELVSAVYDQFLSAPDRAPKGQFHTPMHLATSVVSQLWDDRQLLTKKAKEGGRFLDPACGSGIFLACIFKRLCEHWRDSKGTEKIRWPRLLAFLDQLTGVDIDASAVRVAIFSLHIALLEEVTPPDIRKLMAQGKMLPRLWGRGLRHADFFRMGTARKYDVLIGNPPWRSGDPSTEQWCLEHGLPVPDKQMAWGFAWKTIRHLNQDGKLALLLPAKPFLHNQKATVARNRLLQELRAYRIVNYSDLRHQLFGSAVQPTALFIGGLNHSREPYWFHYWFPKADPGWAAAGVLTLTDPDKLRPDTIQLEKDPHLFKRRLWMTGPEDKLFAYLSRFPSLRETVEQFRDVQKKALDPDVWVIGQGLKLPHSARVGDPDYDTKPTEAAMRQLLPSDAFQVISPNLTALVPMQHQELHRRGFLRGFEGPRILVKKGVGADHRLRAAYTEYPFAFQDAIRAIVVPESAKDLAKLLTAILNSRLMLWFAFHGPSTMGIERPTVEQHHLLELPFPRPDETPEPDRSRKAVRAAVALVDEATRGVEDALRPANLADDYLDRLDRIAYDYFCLSREEIVLVEDTIEYTVPGLQPRSGERPKIWDGTTPGQRRRFADTLLDALAGWTQDGTHIAASIIARNQDHIVLKLRLCSQEDWTAYEDSASDLGAALTRLAEVTKEGLSWNLQRVPDLRVYEGDNLYLVKPNKLRFWTRTAARVDAEEILLDLWAHPEERDDRQQ